MAVTIPWSEDPEENRRNIQAAMDEGETEINGERDADGNPKKYRLDRLPVPRRASLAECHLGVRNEDRGTGPSDDQ